MAKAHPGLRKLQKAIASKQDAIAKKAGITLAPRSKGSGAGHYEIDGTSVKFVKG